MKSNGLYLLVMLLLSSIDSFAFEQTRNRIESASGDAQSWAYEFLESQTSGKPSILDSPSGAIVFQNPQWIVTASEEMANVGNQKADLFFYDARTLKLVTSARIPNKAIKVGSIGDVFYVVTITPRKFKYDDAPLVISLIDPKTNDIDRVKLVEDDYWLALQHPIVISADGNNLVVQYDPEAKTPGTKSEYVCSQPQNKHFADIHISLKPIPKGYVSQLPLPIDSSTKEFEQQAGNESAALRDLGISLHEKTNINAIKDEKASAALVSDGKSKELHFVRATPDGSIHDINIDTLQSIRFKVSSAAPKTPGVFSDGTFRCVVNQRPLFIKNSRPLKNDLEKSTVTFNEDHAFSMPLQSENTALKTTEFPIFKIDPAGGKQQIALPPLGSFTIGDIAVHPEKDVLFTFERKDELDNIFKRYSLHTGRQVGKSIITTTGKTPSADCIQDGIATNGHHLICVITDFSTQGAGFSILCMKDNGQPDLTLASGLSDLTDVLEMRRDAHGKILLLYSCAGIVKYSVYSDTGKLELSEEIQFSPMEGNPFLLSEKDLLFIPKTGGYDAYHVFKSYKPEKAFELFVRGDSQYAILLPSGAYAGSPGCEALLNLPANGSKIDSYSLSPWRNRPSLVIKALGGDPRTAELLEKVTDRWLRRIGFDSNTLEPTANEIAKVSVPQMPPLWAPSSQVVFPIEATAGSESLKEVTVRVNGVLQRNFNGNELGIQPGGHATLDATVNLAEGQNWIEVTATDVKGRPSNLEHFRTILPKAQETPKRYIVAMGCSEYDRSELNLQYAAKDAGDVLKTFSEAGGRESKTLLLTNKDDDPEALEKIKAFTADSKESDEVILFCAGHGMLDEHLDYVYAGHNFDPEHPGQTGIKLDDLIAAISAGKSLKRLILMDTCQSGLVGEKDEMKLAQMDTTLPTGVRAIKNRGMKVLPVALMSGTDQQRFIEELFLLPGFHRGVNIIGASGGSEYAMESSQWNNGVFTSSIIEAIRDKKADMNNRGRISVSDLKTYLAKRVPELTGGAQKPSVVAFEQDQDFDLVGKMPPVPKSVMNTHAAPESSGSINQNTAPTPSPVSPGQTAQAKLGAAFVNSLGQKYVPIPGASAYFCIWDTRVKDYGQFVKETGRAWKPAGFPQKPEHPAVRVTYDDAVEFCKWLTLKEQAGGTLPSGYEYRLPKDLEWSAAAGIGSEIDGQPAWRSGGVPSCYSWGSAWPPPAGSGNYDPRLKVDKYENTSPVGSFPPNKFGLHDMNGNVYQWIQEPYDDSEQGCLRGGSWADEEEESINLTNRFAASRQSNGKCYGFRCVLAPTSQ